MISEKFNLNVIRNLENAEIVLLCKLANLSGIVASTE